MPAVFYAVQLVPSLPLVTHKTYQLSASSTASYIVTDFYRLFAKMAYAGKFLALCNRALAGIKG